MGKPHEWAKLVLTITSAPQNSIILSVTFLSWQPEEVDDLQFDKKKG